MTTLPIRPDELAERNHLRSCRNCSGYDKGRCRKGAPGPYGWPEVLPLDWCMDWCWLTNPRVTWNSGIAPLEREQATEERTPF